MAARIGWTGIGIAAGLAVVLAGPTWLAWDALRLPAWNQQTLKVRFQSVRYEAGGLVFGYVVENRTYRTARILREHTQLRALQQVDRPLVGYPNLPLPLVLPAHTRQTVEIRLELPAMRSQDLSDEQTRQILQNPLRDQTEGDAPVSPLPMRKPPVEETARTSPVPAFRLPDESLADLDGFELVNEPQSARIHFPRGW